MYAVQAAPSDKVDCSKVEEILDDMGAAQGMTTLNDKYKLQTTPDEYTKRCQEMSDAVKVLRKYNKECYSSLTQQVLSAMLRTRSQMNEERCKDPNSEAFKEGLEGVKCVAENAVEKVREAEKKIVLSFQVLHEASIPDDKLRVRRSCCAVQDSKRLFLEATKEKCSKHEALYNQYVESFSSEAMGLICPELDKLECSKLEPIKTDGVEIKSKFFLTPMVKLVKTLDH